MYTYTYMYMFVHYGRKVKKDGTPVFSMSASAFSLAVQDHTRFVNIVRFSPSGEFFCSGAADGQALLYDGKTAEKVGALGGDSPAHSGGIYCVSGRVAACSSIGAFVSAQSFS